MLDRGLRPDLLVTDFNRGPGQNGKALARTVARRFPRLPTIFVTGNPECFADHPMAAWERLIAKPFAIAELLAAVGELRSDDHLRPSGTFAPGTADRGFPLTAACDYPVREQFAL